VSFQDFLLSYSLTYAGPQSTFISFDFLAFRIVTHRNGCCNCGLETGKQKYLRLAWPGPKWNRRPLQS